MENKNEIIDIIKKFIFQYFKIEIIDAMERLGGKRSFNYAVKSTIRKINHKQL